MLFGKKKTTEEATSDEKMQEATVKVAEEKKPLADVTALKVGDDIEGKVIAIDRSAVYIDIPPVGTGIIYGREFLVAKDILRKTHVGDTISARVIALETPEGDYIDLSLREARRALIWAEAEQSMRDGRTYELTVKVANRGGLIVEWNDIRGFIPASQLSEAHYPKVANPTDKDAVMSELKKLVGQKLTLSIVAVDNKTDYLIFSEQKKKGGRMETETAHTNTERRIYHAGEILEGVVTGVVDFGVFIKVDDNVEGLVHISEIDWGLVDDPRRFYKVGDSVSVKLLEVAENKYSFSVKALQKNPWESAGERYKTNDNVTAVVFKYSTHGAFASIEAGVSGLVHISNFTDEAEMKSKLELGKSYKFTISNFDPKEQKLTLIPDNK